MVGSSTSTVVGLESLIPRYYHHYLETQWPELASSHEEALKQVRSCNASVVVACKSRSLPDLPLVLFR
jgi:hypothetical protein